MSKEINAAKNAAPSARQSMSIPVLQGQMASLLGSWKFDRRACSLRSMQKTIDAAGQNIVAVEGVWDAECRTWATASPIVVQLERCTLALAPVDGCHVAVSVLTDEQAKALAEFRAAGVAEGAQGADGPNDGQMLIPLPFCQFAAGLHVASFAFGTCTEGLLTCIEARFSDGGRLTLGAQGPQLQPASRRKSYALAA